MEELDTEVNWLEGSGEDLVEQLLHNEAPLYLWNREHDGNSTPIVPMPDRRLGRAEYMYTLRIKKCGNGLADDGYKWRKYGEKPIKNSPNPRSYYRCTNEPCNARKQVEKSFDDPETLIVAYIGLHLHHTCFHFLGSKSQGNSSASLPKPNKAKIQAPSLQHRPAIVEGLQAVMAEAPTEETGKAPVQSIAVNPNDWFQAVNPNDWFQAVMAEENHAPTEETVKAPVQLIAENPNDWFLEETEQIQQGMLQDIVPLQVRKPSSHPSTSSQVPSTSSVPWYDGAPFLYY